VANLIFDYDGTLHNTMKIYEPSFRKAYAYLVSIGKAEERVIESNEISSWLGYSGEEMWKRFFA
jgi:phosphoglycolate phosphatase